MSSAVPAAAPRSPLVWVFLLLLMLASGAAIPAQGRVNAALTAEIGDPVLAATISFSVGSVILLLVTFGTPRGRRAMARVAPAVRDGRIRWWYFLAGCVGAYFVLTQTLTIGLIGVAVFTVAVVTGQTLGGLLWDRIGLGPAGRMRLNPFRVGGAVLTVLAVLWAVSPQLGAPGQGLAWLALVLLPLSRRVPPSRSAGDQRPTLRGLCLAGAGHAVQLPGRHAVPAPGLGRQGPAHRGRARAVADLVALPGRTAGHHLHRPGRAAGHPGGGADRRDGHDRGPAPGLAAARRAAPDAGLLGHHCHGAGHRADPDRGDPGLAAGYPARAPRSPVRCLSR